MWADIVRKNPDDYYGKVYLIYIFVLLFVSLLMFYFYLKQTQMKQMFYQARILFYFVLFNFILLIILLIPFYSKGYKHFIFNQTCDNGNDYLPLTLGFAKNESLYCYNKTLSPADTTPATQGEFTKSLVNAPIITFCNLFSIYYLEIMSITKLRSEKSKSD